MILEECQKNSDDCYDIQSGKMYKIVLRENERKKNSNTNYFFTQDLGPKLSQLDNVIIFICETNKHYHRFMWNGKIIKCLNRGAFISGQHHIFYEILNGR